MADAPTNWYMDAIAAKWNNPKVREAILGFLDQLDRECRCYGRWEWDHEKLEPMEDAVFGPRVEHPECGSLNLPGAPECWGCEEKLTWEEPVAPPQPAEGKL